MAVDALEQVGAVVAGLDPAEVPVGELGECLVVFERVCAQLEAAKLAFTARWDKAGGWADDGALAPGTWLRSRTAVSATAAYRQVRTARALEAAPAVSAAFRAGDLSTAKMRLLAPLAVGDTAELFARDEAALVEAAAGATAEAAAQLVRYWRACADDELGRPDQTAEQLEADQSLHVSSTFQGAVVADLQLAPVEGAIWRDELDRLTEELWQASSEPERADIGPARRRAAAQVEMARRSAEWRADATGRIVPLFVGVVDLDVLEGRTGRLCQTDRGGRMTPRQVHDWLEDANFVPLLTGPGGAVLHFGRSRRVASAKQRQAVAIRDGHCAFTGCDRPAGHADTHHLLPWELGGTTDIDNLALLCHRHHHDAVHQRGFTSDRDENGQLRWRRPDGTLIPNPYRDWHPATDPPLPFSSPRTPTAGAGGLEADRPDADGVAASDAVPGRDRRTVAGSASDAGAVAPDDAGGGDQSDALEPFGHGDVHRVPPPNGEVGGYVAGPTGSGDTLGGPDSGSPPTSPEPATGAGGKWPGRLWDAGEEASGSGGEAAQPATGACGEAAEPAGPRPGHPAPETDVAATAAAAVDSGRPMTGDEVGPPLDIGSPLDGSSPAATTGEPGDEPVR